MAIDPKKLTAFKQEQDGNPDGGGDAEIVAEGEPISAEEDVSEEAQNERKMDPQVAYMELDQDAGAFSCGTCSFGMPTDEKDKGTCIHPQVRAQVSTKAGCCNFFTPTEDIGVIFPPDFKAESDEDEEEPEDEEEESQEESGDDDEEEGEEAD